MSHWLLREDIAHALAAARQRGVPTADVLAHEERAVEAARDNGPRSLTLAGDVAEIRVVGVLTQRPDFWAWLLGLGNTTYPDLQAAIGVAHGDPNVKSVRLFVNSPGGELDGLFDTLAALETLRAAKPVTVRAENAFSAAYGIAAVAGPIQAQNAASSFGSVGVVQSHLIEEDRVDVTNTDSPDKRPDVTTAEGRAVVVRYLDAVAALFVDAIAAGRETTVKDVAENFGRGALIVASDAKRLGMIDSVVKKSSARRASARAQNEETQNVSATNGGQENEMAQEELTLETLRANHRAVFDAAVAEGADGERDRVLAHLTMGEHAGALDTAIGAIRAGSGMTLELQAEYLTAGMNRADVATRQAESDAAGAAADGAKGNDPATAGSFASQVADAMAASRGKGVNRA